MAGVGGDVPVDLVIRFSTSNPDIILTIAKPSSTTCLSLKQEIRAHLETPASTSRLRLIHAGKVLADTTALSKSLNVTLPPPTTAHSQDGDRSEKARGKQPVRDDTKSTQVVRARVYIHCSVGDSLTSADLSTEAKAAEEADAALLNTHATLSQSTILNTTTTSTTPAPQGFDRLASALSPAEITSLRASFLAIQAHTHTPDTMPSGPELLALEEAWLDSSASPNAAAGPEGDGEDAGGLEDMLWGNLIGFFWPVGAVFWVMREEGIWSRRKQIAVLSGFLVGICFGGLRVLN